jgi:hypothetical protein
VLNAPEIREVTLEGMERAVARDSFVRNWVATVQNWREVARACVGMESDRDFERLGFSSMDAWFISVASEERSRSYLHLICGQYKALASMVPDESQADGIKLGSVSILRKLSPAVRSDPRILKAAKERPERLAEVLEKEFPEQHIEATINKRCRFPKSMWEKTIEPKFKAWLLENESGTFEEFIEDLCA